MRIKEISIKNVPPVKCFEATNLSDVIVLAGRNGIGKTRLVQGLLQYFQNPTGLHNVRLVIDATCDKERESWGKHQLNTEQPNDASRLQKTLQETRLRRNWKSSIINIESDRSIQKIAPYKFSWNIIDPYEEQVGWNFTFGGLRARYQDTIHSIFRKVQAHRNRISTKAERLFRKGEKTMELNFTDPLEAFKYAFRQLLAPKELLDADLQNQQLKYQHEGDSFLLNTLSSGETEVINIVFDFLLRKPADCVVFFDEPELHLHPELSYKLIQTLTSLGENNQFIFCTHSPEIITASLEHSVIFIGPPKSEEENQAIPVHEDDKTNHALKLLGQSVGIIALGKKIVLIEGTHTSLDKQTYGAILKDSFPDLVIVPSGGKGLIKSFSSLINEVLDQSIWGVDFFMLCDRDAIPFTKNPAEIESKSNGRLKVLGRYHLENYFLDERILSKIFEKFEPEDSWLRSQASIRQVLRKIAKEMVSYAVALYSSAYFREQVGNVDIMPKNCHGKEQTELIELIAKVSSEEKNRIDTVLDTKNIESFVSKTADLLISSLNEDTDKWKELIPGKRMLSIFSSKAGIPLGRLKRAYLNEAGQSENNPFQEIINIFEEYNSIN